MKQSNTCLLSLFITLTCLNAQAAIPWKKYEKLQTLQASFQQTKRVKDLDLTLKSSGTIDFRRPDYFAWRVLAPRAVAMIFKADAIEFWENDVQVKGISVSQLDGKMLTAITHLKAWLTLDRAFIETHYAIRELSATSFELTPKGETKFFKKINLVTGASHPIKSIEFVELSDDSMALEFSKNQVTYAR